MRAMFSILRMRRGFQYMNAAWFDEPLWRFRVLDKLGVKLKEEDFGRLQEVIKELVDNEAFEKGRREVAEEVRQYKGETAKRVVDYLVLKTGSMEDVSTG